MNMNLIHVNLDGSNEPASLFDTNMRRSYRGDQAGNRGKAFITVPNGINEKGEPMFKAVQVGNATTATLEKDEWKQLDSAIIQVAQRRMRLVNLLESKGCVINLKNGLGTTVFEWQSINDMSGATLDMDGLKQDDVDRLIYKLESIPLPIVSKNWRLNLRFLEQSRIRGAGMDTLLAAECARVVADYCENMLINGTSSFSYGGGTIYGLLDYVGRTTGNITADWAASGATGDVIVNDVQAMIQAGADQHHHGPFIMVLPQRYERKLTTDYSTLKGENTIQDRIMKLNKISEIVFSDFLGAASTDVVLFEPVKENIAIINGMALRDFEWQSLGGWVNEHKVATIKVPLFREDFKGQCGIIHYKVA